MTCLPEESTRSARALAGASRLDRDKNHLPKTVGRRAQTNGIKAVNSLLAGLRRLVVTMSAVAALSGGALAASDADFLDPDDAFKSSVSTSADGRSLVIGWQVAEGYHLYGSRMAVTAASPQVQLGVPQRTAGKIAFDPILKETVETLGGNFEVRIPIEKAPANFEVELTSQGCADAGLCYPPQSKQIPIVLAAAVVGTQTISAAPKGPAMIEDDSGVGRALKSGSLLQVVPLFLLLGLLLSFTPCVLPMVPILSSIIVGQGTTVTRQRGLALSVAYAMGMATVYTAMGVAAGLAGEGIAGALQHPAVLGSFALILALLALSMFDAFTLQMPSSIQSKLSSASDKLPGGKFTSVFVMGSLSAMIVGPCVAAPLAGALVYIGSTRDVVLGGAALFAMACGMSVPLLLTGLSAGSLLPRAGAWMVGVKSFFGVLLLGVALWMVAPVMPAWASMLGWAALAIGCASMLRAFDPLPDNARGLRRLGKGLGMLVFVAGAMELAGIAMGGTDPLKPLAPLAQASTASAGIANTDAGANRAAGAGELRFRSVASSGELDALLGQSARPVLVDFYADWCVACKEMERFTFSDPKVKAQLAGFELLRADVTRNDDASKALMKRFGLFGPPGLVFMKPGAGEIDGSRVIGYRKASEMVSHLERVAAIGSN